MNQMITTINPATGEQLATYAIHTSAQVNAALKSGQHCFESYRKTTIDDRATWLLNVAKLLEERKEQYALAITHEMGKPLKSSRAEIEKCIWLCEYYAEHAAAFLADEIVETGSQKSMVSYRPMGVLLAVMPWNFPFWQVLRFAAPALMAGNVCVLKHASNVPQCALFLEAVFRDAGFPKYAFSTLLIPSSQVAAVIENPIVKAVMLTGSGPAGSAVASTAGKVLKKSVLELGGSDPYLILADADLDLAAEQSVVSRMRNSGQSCIGAKRFIVVADIYEDFLARLIDRVSQATMGDPMTDVDLGPLARVDLRDEVHAQVMKSVEQGAKVILGGAIPDGQGAYYPPTILTEVAPGQPAYDDEIFGPVVSVIKVNDEAEAIRVANDSIYGLGAAVFTRDIVRGERIATYEIEAGSCFVNRLVRSDPRLPFGGINASGYGRELGRFGIREFVNIKTVSVG